MKILVLAGSPHLRGTSNTLVEKFIEGAKESGHEIEVYDAAKGNIHPCLGCDRCGMNGSCIQADDGNDLIKKILNVDMLLFATPVYYFGMSAQLKTVIDRFYARNSQITRKHLKGAVIATAWNNDEVVMSALEKHFEIIFDYLNIDNQGMILAKGAISPAMLPKEYLDAAISLGRRLK